MIFHLLGLRTPEMLLSRRPPCNLQCFNFHLGNGSSTEFVNHSLVLGEFGNLHLGLSEQILLLNVSSFQSVAFYLHGCILNFIFIANMFSTFVQAHYFDILSVNKPR